VINFRLNNIKERKLAKSKAHLINDPNNLLFAFKQTKTIFIHIPKTAGISLIHAIYGNVNGGGHRSFNFYKYIYGENISNFFTFSFVRNPYQRLYSAYNYLKQGGINLHDRKAFETHLYQFKNFKDFVLNGLNEKLINEIIHFTPQSHFICDNRDNILIDFVGKYENIANDISYIENEMNFSLSLPHLNKSNLNSVIIDDKVKSRIFDIYKRDFKIFNYH
jgi:hypothetical protein